MLEMAEIIDLDDARDAREPNREEPWWKAVAPCRECGKLIGVSGEWHGDKFAIMSTGGPIFGKCPSLRPYPGCGDKFADTAYVAQPPRVQGDGYVAPYYLDPKEIE
jgi:hypothetical protein